MHFVQHGLREFLTRPRDYSPVVARHLLFDPDGLLATAAFMACSLREQTNQFTKDFLAITCRPEIWSVLSTPKHRMEVPDESTRVRTICKRSYAQSSTDVARCCAA